MLFTGVAIFHISTDRKADSKRSPFLPWIPKLYCHVRKDPALYHIRARPSTLFKIHLKSVQQDRQFTYKTPARSRCVCTSLAILTVCTILFAHSSFVAI